ncbi:MAG: hypothetical protein FJX57_14385 [Alphaproteobacteria bacterium]|nr:hypothetical protein [Alphaproteobacteria bacterium]
MIRQLGRAAGIVDEEDADARSAKLAALAERSGIGAARAVPLLAALLSVAPTVAYPAPDMTPQQQKAATLALLVDLLAGLAQDVPVLMVLEDLHWIDPTTRELFDLLVARIAELPVLLLVTFRPEIATPWEGRGHVTLLPLNRLGRRQVEALVVAVAHGKALPAEVVEQIAAKADGVPLFVEELTKAVVEGGLLREAADRYELTGPLPALAVPSSLQASLVARLDRLSTARDVAQTGAALGREFDFELLAAVSTQSERQLGAALAELERAELVFARGAPPHTSWIFKHALIQDAAYGTLLRSARVTLHARIADTIRSRFPALAEREPETLARHCFEAGRLVDAAGLWEQAGDRAADRSAIAESLAHYDRASACLRTIGDGATGHGAHIAEIGLKWAQVLLQVEGFASAAVERTLVQAIEEADRADALDLALRARMARNVCFFTRLQFREALDHVLHRLPSDEAALAHATRVHVLQTTAISRFALGNFSGAAAEWTTSLALDDSAPVTWGGPGGALPSVVGRSYLSWVTAIFGQLDDSVRHGRDALDRARPVGHHFSTAWAHLAHARGLSRMGDWQGTADSARAGLEITRRYGFLAREGNLRQYLGLALLHLGEVDAGAVEIAEGVALWMRYAGRFNMTIWYTDCALALLDTRHEAMARDWIMRARSLHDGSQERVGSAEILRAEGLVSLRDGASDEAERLFRAALAVASSQQARLYELRAATDLARLLAERSRRAEARDILAPLYAWFTQGFASPDLRRARTLLDEIGG